MRPARAGLTAFGTLDLANRGLAPVRQQAAPGDPSMFNRSALALALALTATEVASAGLITFNSSVTTTNFVQAGATDGFLTFGITSSVFNLGSIDPGDPLAQSDLTAYNKFNSTAPTSGIRNGTLTYSLILDIFNTSTNELETIDVGGLGNGGIRADTRTFINDSFNSVAVNGKSVPFTTDPVTAQPKALFSLAFSDGNFLNVKLFDPNPDFDTFSPEKGIRGEFVTSLQPLYDTVITAQAVPEPATVSLACVGLAILGARRLRKSAVR
jgi:hypothetical protein